MKNLIIVATILFSCTIASAQKIFSVNSQSYADVKVYVVSSESYADLLVAITITGIFSSINAIGPCFISAAG